MKEALALAAYLTSCALTFGDVFNSMSTDCSASWKTEKQKSQCFAGSVASGLFVAPFGPIYLAARAGVWVMK